MKSIIKVLEEALRGEEEAITLYKEFEKSAAKSNLPNLSALFSALVQAENVHVKNHTSAINHIAEKGKIEIKKLDQGIGKIGSNLENIQVAFDSETEEYKKIYPNWISQCKKSKKSFEQKLAILSLQWAMKVEKNHAEILKIALKCAIEKKDFSVADIYFCRVCGRIEIGKIEEDGICQICGHDNTFYKKADSKEIN